MTYDIPNPPDSWTIATNVESHISFSYRPENRSIVCLSMGDPTLGNWKVKGLAGYDGDHYPVFAKRESVQTAIEVAFEVMNAIAEDEEIEPVTRKEPAFGVESVETVSEDSDTSGDQAAPDGESTDSDDTAEDDDKAQPDLTSFMD